RSAVLPTRNDFLPACPIRRDSPPEAWINPPKALGRSQDHVAEVSVADTGIGIAPADQDAVFDEFRQVGTADKKAEGTGLGLALSRKFIELHGGKIWVQSELRRGSTFTFTLPLRR